MAPRPPTLLEQLRESGRYIDHSLLPTQNEIPGVLAALVYGPGLADKISQLRQDGKADVEISHEVAHAIAPPDPDANATVVQGVPTEQYNALQREIVELRGLVESLASQRLQTAQGEAQVQSGAPPAQPPPTVQPGVPEPAPAPAPAAAEPAPAASSFTQLPAAYGSDAEANVQGRLAADPVLAEQTAAAEAAQRAALARATGEHPVVTQSEGPSEVEQLRALVTQLGGNPDDKPPAG